MAKRLTAVCTAVAGVAVLAGCSSSSSGGVLAGSVTTSPPSITAPPTPKATPTPTPTGPSTPIPAVTKTVTASPTTATAAARNLVASPAVRNQMVAAGAKTHGLKAADYTGLVPGETYYAYDPATSTYWAGAGLVPSSSSMPAQVSVQDDGSYLVFMRPASGSWSAMNVGLAGVAGSTCPITVPTDVIAVWHWKSGGCRPPS